MAARNALVLIAGAISELPSGDTLSGAAGGSPVFSSFEQNLGAIPRRSGHFTVSGLTGLATGKPVMLQQAAGPYSGKSTVGDDAEFDHVAATGQTISATQIKVYWTAPWRVAGNFKFNYLIGA